MMESDCVIEAWKNYDNLLTEHRRASFFETAPTTTHEKMTFEEIRDLFSHPTAIDNSLFIFRPTRPEKTQDYNEYKRSTQYISSDLLINTYLQDQLENIHAQMYKKILDNLI